MDFANSTEKLLYNVLSKVIPKQVLDFVQNGGLQNFMTSVGNKLKEIEDKQDTILAQQTRILELLDNERSGNGERDGSPLRIVGRTGTD